MHAYMHVFSWFLLNILVVFKKVFQYRAFSGEISLENVKIGLRTELKLLTIRDKK
jgi:hypothetical protein